MGVDAIKDQLDEAQKAYHKQKHRKLVQWEGEADAAFKRREGRHDYRVKHLDKLTDHLRRKLKAQKKKRDEREEEKRDGVVIFDGKPVAAWIAKWLERSRRAGWKGVVTSGYRSPEYSESLCFNMCGQPSCPGLCAGRASNHSGKNYPAGAVDVSDYTNFERIQYEIGSPLRNDLPIDPVHFSVNGH